MLKFLMQIKMTRTLIYPSILNVSSLCTSTVLDLNVCSSMLVFLKLLLNQLANFKLMIQDSWIHHTESSPNYASTKSFCYAERWTYLFPVMYHLWEIYRAAFSKLIQNTCHCTKKANMPQKYTNQLLDNEVGKILGIDVVFKLKCIIWQHFIKTACLYVRTESSLLNTRELQHHISNTVRSKDKVQQIPQHTLIIIKLL